MSDYGVEMNERMARLETEVKGVHGRLDEVITIAKEDREMRQKMASVMDAITSLDQRMTRLDAQSNPILHASPPVMTQLHDHARDINALAMIAKNNKTSLGEVQDSIKWLARTVGGALILGFVAAFIQFGPS